MIVPITPTVAKITQLVTLPIGFLTNNFNHVDALPSDMFMGSVLVRGGAEQVLDLARTRLRLEGLSAYGVVTALLMNASLRLFSSTPTRMQPNDMFNNIIKGIFAVNFCVSVTTASYTTIVFSLLGLYSKTALGMGYDDKFLQFFEATSDVRESGFDAFIIALVTFKIAFNMSLFLNFQGKFRWFITAFAIFSALMFWWRWSSIITLAQTLLFS